MIEVQKRLARDATQIWRKWLMFRNPAKIKAYKQTLGWTKYFARNELGKVSTNNLCHDDVWMSSTALMGDTYIQKP